MKKVTRCYGCEKITRVYGSYHAGIKEVKMLGTRAPSDKWEKIVLCKSCYLEAGYKQRGKDTKKQKGQGNEAGKGNS